MIKNILIIEDEAPNAARLRRLISVVYPQAVIVRVLDNVADSVQWLKTNPSPDLIMLDVRLADGSSFEILEQVKVSCPIIFTTAYDEYAVKAFKYNSVDYLLKPIEQDELASAIERAAQRDQETSVHTIERLLDNIAKKEFRSRFLLPHRDGFKTINVSDIQYICSELKITRAILYNGEEEILSQSLEELEEQLDPKLFFRANRQFIVHFEAIARLHNYFNGKLKIELKKNAAVEIVVSREKASALKAWLDY